MGYYAVKEIYPWLHSIHDPQNVFCYLVVGSEWALLFDTAHGIGDLHGAINEVTDKPVVTVLGHGHLDHACGAYQFDEVWLHGDDFAVCQRHTSEKYRRHILGELAAGGHALPEGFDGDAYVRAGTGNLKEMAPGQVFDLGGLHVEVVSMEGHTAGSVGLLVREHRVLLDSDSANAHVWVFLPESLPVGRYADMLERVVRLDFDTFFTGHSGKPRPKSDFMKYIGAARNVSPEKSEPYPEFPWLKGHLYKEDGAEIVFSMEKL